MDQFITILSLVAAIITGVASFLWSERRAKAINREVQAIEKEKEAILRESQMKDAHIDFLKSTRPAALLKELAAINAYASKKAAELEELREKSAEQEQQLQNLKRLLEIVPERKKLQDIGAQFDQYVKTYAYIRDVFTNEKMHKNPELAALLYDSDLPEWLTADDSDLPPLTEEELANPPDWLLEDN